MFMHLLTCVYDTGDNQLQMRAIILGQMLFRLDSLLGMIGTMEVAHMNMPGANTHLYSVAYLGLVVEPQLHRRLHVVAALPCRLLRLGHDAVALDPPLVQRLARGAHAWIRRTPV